MSKPEADNSSPESPTQAVYGFAHHTSGTVRVGNPGLQAKEGEMSQLQVVVGGSDNVFSKDNTDRYVASGPTTPRNSENWFELAAELCHSGLITETRMRRAMDKVREAVSR